MMLKEVIMEYKILMQWDEESQVWIATSDEIPGLVLESGSYDALIEKVRIAAPEILELNGQETASGYRYYSERYQRALA